MQVTANHYITDAMAGATVVGISYFLATHVPQFGRGAPRDWGPAFYWITGPNSSIVLVAPAEARNRESGDSEGLPLLAQVRGTQTKHLAPFQKYVISPKCAAAEFLSRSGATRCVFMLCWTLSASAVHPC